MTIIAVEPHVLVTGASISGYSTVTVGSNVTLTATVSPSNGYFTGVWWNVSNGNASLGTETATSTGAKVVITGEKAGTVIVTADIKGDNGETIATATKTITVTEPEILVTSVSISGNSTVTVGSSITLTATTSPSTADDRHVTWSITTGSTRVTYTTSDTTTGGRIVLTGVSAGTVTVKATAADGSGEYATKTITVQSPSNSFTLSYNGNGGSGVPSSQSGSSTSSSYSFTIPATTPSRSGYTFVEWNTRSSGTGTSYDPGDRITVSPGTTTLYAIWDQIEYTCRLNFSASGASNVPSNMSYTGTSTSSHSFTIPSTIPTRNGYTFVEWNTNSSGTGTGYDPGDRISVGYNQTETLYAIWEQVRYTCHLNYSASGATNVPSNQSYTGTSTSSHVFTISSQEPVRNGYIFKGWSTSSGGSAQYQPGDTISVGYNSTMTLYAVWESAQLNITTTQSDITLTVGQGFNYTVGTSTSGCTVSVSGASWLHVSGSTVSGTPTSPGEFDVTVTISKAGYTSDSQSFTVTVVSVLGFTSSPVNGLIVIEV